MTEYDTLSKVTEVLFLGTGTSSCIPNVPCIMKDPPTCKVCTSSITEKGKKNKRRNTSALVKIVDQSQKVKNVLIDCGKTFYESTVEHFPPNGINSIDAVFITHGHADAILGLDDLRQWTTHKNNSLNVFLNQETFDVIASTFPYIVDTSKATGGGEVPSLSFNVFENDSVIEVFGIEFTPLPVEHGLVKNKEPYFSLGFKFSNISYISDCSSIPESTHKLMKNSDVIVVDCLKWDSHLSHFGYKDAIDTVLLHRPKLSIFTDFCHSIDHYDLLESLEKFNAEEELHVVPSFDGQVLHIANGEYTLSS
ncbi:putative hydrolase [Smittium culicis]|uniref:Putative hydrolase n=1 Tax=Smittium culicis TaxID=133412 RepID=A0A1R1X0I2_9FUNG|nr:putative hydrolase [Smittium culicis]